MQHPIGFAPQLVEGERYFPQPYHDITPVKSLAQVHFPDQGQTYTYFNDLYYLQVGDFVFVEGKMEGIRGIVLEVSKSFKIKVSDYKKVIGFANTEISGQLHIAGSHFVSFNPSVLPYEQIRTWYLPPLKPEDIYEIGTGGKAFPLNDLGAMDVSATVGERGNEYYSDNRVRYLCLEGCHGRAIVEGDRAYELEFDLIDGIVHNLVCSCPCGYTCKHAVAAMLQLRETLGMIACHYPTAPQTYFAAIAKRELFRFVIGRQEAGSFTLEMP